VQKGTTEFREHKGSYGAKIDRLNANNSLKI